jgi:MraZ protein
VERRIWIGLLAGLLPVLALVAFVGMLLYDRAVTAPAAGPARSSLAKPEADKEATPTRVTLEPPAPAPVEPVPQAHLLQPEPPPPLPAPEPPPRTITVARWPLGAPATHEPPPAPATGGWSRPVPLEPSVSNTEVALASAPAQTMPLKPVPSPVAVTFPKREKEPGARPLTGEYPCTLAGRELTLPQEVRQQLGASNRRQLYVTPAPDGCLWLHTAAGLDRLADRLDHASGSAARVRKAARVCFSQTETCGLDRGGRFVLPERLAQYAGLQQEAVLLGVGDHLELWDAQRWQQYTQTQEKGMR